MSVRTNIYEKQIFKLKKIKIIQINKKQSKSKLETFSKLFSNLKWQKKTEFQ